jgi:hypothetical protein
MRYENSENVGRRLRILEISPDLLAFITSGTFRVTAGAMPADAKIWNRFYDPYRDVFCVVLAHESFEEVKPFGRIPPHGPIWIERVETNISPEIIPPTQSAGVTLNPEP